MVIEIGSFTISLNFLKACKLSSKQCDKMAKLF